ncbi:MAG TPA: zinc-binding dehydrogenase [Vicinamibacterales bacterium]|nr:zinc-binding dehydrogenase [Vicinamibacterales bacterium]
MTRDVWRINRAGSLARLRKQSETLPPPAAGEARVRVKTVGLNFADIFACLGLYSATPKGPFVPGLEFAGVIEETVPPARGHEASAHAGLRAGDAVAGLIRFGAYATVLNAPAHLLSRIPPGWTMAQAAAFPAQGLTAWYGLVEQARVTNGELVLLHSAAGGVGLCALAILRSIGARIVATVGREEKRQFLVKRYGFSPELVIVRDRRRFGDQLDRALHAVTSDGFDVVFDAVAGPFLEPAFARLRPRGRLVVYGAADFMPGGRRAVDPRLLVRYLRRHRIDPLRLMTLNRSVIGYNLIWLWDRADRLPEAYAALRSLCPEPPLVGRQFPFDQAPAAMRFLQSGRSIGKVVLDTSLTRVASPGDEAPA